MAIVLISSDLKELLSLCHRILVVRDAAVVAELPASASERDIVERRWSALRRQPHERVRSNLRGARRRVAASPRRVLGGVALGQDEVPFITSPDQVTLAMLELPPSAPPIS